MDLLKFDPKSMEVKQFMENWSREKEKMQCNSESWDIHQECQAAVTQGKSSKSKEIVAGNSIQGIKDIFSHVIHLFSKYLYLFSFRSRYRGNVKVVRGSGTMNLSFAPRSLKILECWTTFQKNPLKWWLISYTMLNWLNYSNIDSAKNYIFAM